MTRNQDKSTISCHSEIKENSIYAIREIPDSRRDAVGEYGQIIKTTILPADLGTILDPEDYSSAPVPKIPER